MKNKISNTNMKKYTQIGAFLFSFLVHVVLLILLIWPFTKDKNQPNFTVLDVSLIFAEKASSHVGKPITEKIQHQPKTKEAVIVKPTNFHTHSSDEVVGSDSKKVALVANPLPQIPQDLRADAFQSESIARFYVDVAGNVEKVELIKPCANPQLNNLLLKSLRQWKFTPSKTASTQDVKVRFKVE